VGKLEGKRLLGRYRGRLEMTQKWILEKYDGMVWTGFISLSEAISGEL
jgi:hypothetical protein